MMWLMVPFKVRADSLIIKPEYNGMSRLCDYSGSRTLLEPAFLLIKKAVSPAENALVRTKNVKLSNSIHHIE